MNAKVRNILFGILLLGVPVGAWWFVFRPGNVQHAEMREQVRSKQEKLQKLNRLVGTVGNLKAEITSLEKAISFFQSKLPNEKEIDKVLRETWRLAEKNKLVTKSIRTNAQLGPDESMFVTGSHSEQPIVIHLEGRFEGFYTFLQELEAQPRIMRVSRLILTKPKDIEEGFITANFDMSVFFERDGSI